MRKRGITWPAMAACVIAAAGQAGAVTIDFVGSSHNLGIETRRFGQDLLSETAIYTVNAEGVEYQGLCVDFEHGMIPQWSATFEDVGVLDNVYGQPQALTNAGKAIGYLFDQYFPTLNDPVNVAGLQAAFWEILDDFGSLDLNGGRWELRGPENVRIAAQGYLDALNGVNLDAYDPASWVIFSGPDPRVQHMIVPEPATTGLVALGLLLAVRLRRRAWAF